MARAFGADWSRTLEAPPEPFLPSAEVDREADRIRNGVISQLHLQRMPTEFEVALATVFYLADRAVSGESFQPSGGLNVERSSTERELFGGIKQERLDALRGRTVWLIGEHLAAHLATAATSFVEEGKVARVVLLTHGEEGAEAILAKLAPSVREAVHTVAVGDNLEDGIDRLLLEGSAGADGGDFHPIHAVARPNIRTRRLIGSRSIRTDSVTSLRPI